MGWVVSKKKADFIGKRSFARADTARPDRKQLVGLLPDDPRPVLPEGTQLVGRRAAARAAGADARPRHLQLPQRGARPHLRARPGQAAAGSGSASGCYAPVGDELVAGRPSPARFSTTPREHAAMAEPTARRSPLAHVADRFAAASRTSDGALRLAELPFLTQVNVRLDPKGPRLTPSAWPSASRCRSSPTP